MGVVGGLAWKSGPSADELVVRLCLSQHADCNYPYARGDLSLM